MYRIDIDGVIGLDFTNSDVRAHIAAASGDDLEIFINSPGGSVTEAMAIFQSIKNYPNGAFVKIEGMAASAASFIAMAGDSIDVSNNSVLMIHNAWGGTIGDHRDLRKSADIFEGFSSAMAKAYQKKSGIELESVKKMMNDESWFFGQNIKNSGFADFFTDSENSILESDRPELQAKILTAIELTKNIDISAMACNIIEKTEVVTVSEQEIEKIRAEGIMQERKRVSELNQYQGKISAGVDALVIEAIASGKDVLEIRAQLDIEISKKSNDGDNAPNVTVAQVESGDGLSDEDREAMKIFGISLEDYKKYSRKEGK